MRTNKASCFIQRCVMLRYFFAIILFAVMLNACHGPAILKEQQFDGFSVKIADFLVPMKKPEVRSSAYFEDTVNNCLFMVVKESKDSMVAYGLHYTLDSYFDKTSKDLYTKLQGEELDKFNSYYDTINSCKAIVGHIMGRIGEDHLLYYLAIIETKKNFYQLICAMPKDQESRYRKPLNEMIKSFREKE